jgi:hypothetical protein
MCWGACDAGTVTPCKIPVQFAQICNIYGRTRLTQLRRCLRLLDSTMYLYKVLSIQNILNTRRRRKTGQRSHFNVCMDVELEIKIPR